jgi:hypothetical protein
MNFTDPDWKKSPCEAEPPAAQVCREETPSSYITDP